MPEISLEHGSPRIQKIYKRNEYIIKTLQVNVKTIRTKKI